MKIREESRIIDYRSIKELGNYTISSYKKTDVIKALENAFKDNLIENACNWSAELIICGRLKELINIIILYSSKNININNPNLPLHLWKRYKHILTNVDIDAKDVIDLRNDQEIRNVICELVVILCLSKKNNINSLLGIHEYEFNTDHIRDKLKATNYDLVQNILESGDPSEMSMIANEFAYNLHKNNFQMTLYWLSWIIEWEKLNIKKKKTYKCANRFKYTKNDKYASDVIWLVCEIILNEATKYRTHETKLNVLSLINLFKYDFTSSQKYKKMPLIIHTILLISNRINYDELVYISYPITVQASGNINKIYESIKSKELKSRDEINVFEMNKLVRRDKEFNPKSDDKKNITGQKAKKKKKGDISNNSLNKMLLVSQIDDYMYTKSSAEKTLYKDTVKKDKENLEIKKPIDKNIEDINNCLFITKNE